MWSKIRARWTIWLQNKWGQRAPFYRCKFRSELPASAILPRFNCQISPGCRAQRSTKHVDKCADIVVAEFKSDRRHGNLIRDKLERAKQAGLLTPLRESHACLRHKTTAHRSRRETAPCCPLFEAAIVRQVAGQGVRDADKPRIVGTRQT